LHDSVPEDAKKKPEGRDLEQDLQEEPLSCPTHVNAVLLLNAVDDVFLNEGYFTEASRSIHGNVYLLTAFHVYFH
jgi:hypothetical protein